MYSLSPSRSCFLVTALVVFGLPVFALQAANPRSPYVVEEEPSVGRKVTNFFRGVVTGERFRRETPPPPPQYRPGPRPQRFNLDQPPRDSDYRRAPQTNPQSQGQLQTEGPRVRKSPEPLTDPIPTNKKAASTPPANQKTAAESPPKKTTSNQADRTGQERTGSSDSSSDQPKKMPGILKNDSPANSDEESKPAPRESSPPAQETSKPTPPPTEEKTTAASNNPPPSAPQPAANAPLTGSRTEKPGRVKSPYPPYNELDVSGLPSGSLAMDPTTQKVFRVP